MWTGETLMNELLPLLLYPVMSSEGTANCGDDTEGDMAEAMESFTVATPVLTSGSAVDPKTYGDEVETCMPPEENISFEYPPFPPPPPPPPA